MNTTQDTQAKIEKLFSYYIQEIDRYNDTQFEHKESPDTWSLAQMYEHIYSASSFFMYNINNCLQQQKGSTEGDKTQMGEMLYNFGSFPNQKIKQPKEWTTGAPASKTRDECKQQWANLLTQLLDAANTIEADDNNYKTHHVVFGRLNSLEWYQQIEMHTRHHLHQKKELETLAGAEVTNFS